jgi:hypothetical protein
MVYCLVDEKRYKKHFMGLICVKGTSGKVVKGSSVLKLFTLPFVLLL